MHDSFSNNVTLHKETLYIVFYCMLQSYLNGSHSSLKSGSLDLELSGTGQSLGGLGTGRDENINYTFECSDGDANEEVCALVVYLVSLFTFCGQFL